MQAIYRRAGETLGYGLARLMALINPSRIVLTGGSVRAYPLFETGMKEAIEAALVEDLSRSTVIETLPWQTDMIMTGLISYMLTRLDREVFANPAEARRFRIA
jgi:predicted NBD/HSP70 family sugar kinase